MAKKPSRTRLIETPSTSLRRKQAVLHFQAQRFEKARALFDRICKANQDDAEAWFMLGKANMALGLSCEGIACLHNAIAVQPNYGGVCYELGLAYSRLNIPSKAETFLKQAVNLMPESLPALADLGEALAQSGKLGEAIQCYERAIRIDPDNAYVLLKLSSCLLKQGRVGAAVDFLQHITEIRPDAVGAHSCLLSALNYCPQDAAHVFREHIRWNQFHAKKPLSRVGENNHLASKRPLRIGYVSPDFCAHPVFFFIVNLLEKHDPSVVTTYCYSNVACPDAITAQLRALVGNWRDIQKMSDAAVIELVQRDRIDILVDLAGHTANNRLQVFACKPAPVQVSYLGYPNTTGLAVMDYRFTDAWADPPGQTEHLHTETLFRIPGGFLNYNPLKGSPASPPVVQSPYQNNGYITFGSFNNIAKTTAEVIALWARILHAVPGSRLILKNRTLDDSQTCEYFYRQFREHDIERERIDLIGWIPNMGQHMSTYGQIDIALDTFPYNGTTTTCQSIWMGVPVITLAGQTHAGRVGVSLLSQLGLNKLITYSHDQYVACATQLAHDTNSLTTLRRGLREHMAKSHLCNGYAFARQVEHAYQMMWDNLAQKSFKP